MRLNNIFAIQIVEVRRKNILSVIMQAGYIDRMQDNTWNRVSRDLLDLRLVLPPTNKCVIKRVREVRQENSLLPGSKNPDYSLFPAFLSHDRMIGPKTSPCNAGGLVGRHTLSYRKATQGGGAMPKLFVGIDVAKDTSSAQGIDSSVI